MITDMVARKKVTGARTALVLDEPFFGPLALRLELLEDKTCLTAWVDGKTFGYNPSFVNSLPPSELAGLIVHEVMHCAAGHPWRRDMRDPYRWNVACDRVINPILVDAGWKLPDGALMLLDPSHAGKSAEWVYDRIPTPPSPQSGRAGAGQGPGGKGHGNGPAVPQGGQTPQSGGQNSQGLTSPGLGQPDASKGVCPSDTQGAGSQPNHKSSRLGEVRDAPTETAADGSPGPTEEEWKQAVQQAAAMAKGQGKLPASLARYAKAAEKPRVDWRSALRRFMQEVARSDYSWARPNPRYVASAMIMPALRSHEVGVLAVAIDTSGSIDRVLLDQFAAEVQAIADETRPRQVRVLYADARVQREDIFERDEPITMKPHGEGGTDFRPVFKHVLQYDEPPCAVVYLTDLMGTFPETDPSIPTLWVTAEERPRAVPFGEVILAS